MQMFEREERYRQTVAEVLSALDTDAQFGLTRGRAQERLERYGKNELMAEKPKPAWRKFFGQFTDVLVILLLAAGLISAGTWLCRSASALPERYRIHLSRLFRFRLRRSIKACCSLGVWMLAGITFQSWSRLPA
jgi:magnesium-transporting ATPase (P-type)